MNSFSDFLLNKKNRLTRNEHEQSKDDERPESVTVSLVVDVADADEAAADQEDGPHHEEADGVGDRLPRDLPLRQQELKVF